MSDLKATGPTHGHPLDPLSETEVIKAAAAVRAYAAVKAMEALRFNVITLKEPSKAVVVAYENDNTTRPGREAFCMVLTPPLHVVHEVVVALDGDLPSVTSWETVEGVAGVATPDDCIEAEEIIRADPEVQRLLRERYGLSDLSLVRFDPWSVHASPLEGRVIQGFTYSMSSPIDNQYAHPLDIVPIVDLNARKVVRIDTYPQTPVIPGTNSNYHRDLQPGFRDDIKPLNVVQPEGPSFRVDGNLVRWMNWQFRVGFNYREGLVLHELGWWDKGNLRPVLYRASLVEMAVPYADPREPYVRKCAFDVGDYGLGYCTSSLALGCDCLGTIHYFDATLNNAKGEPYVIKNAVCMHEEDYGLLWKHYDYRNGHSESRRSRRLVISFIATVVNYEYCFYWYLYQDGTIQLELKLTGELSTNLLSPGEAQPEYGTLVMPGVNAQHHQHLFCARIDPAIDNAAGTGLVVTEVDAVPMASGPDNPYHNGFRAVETELKSVKEAQRVTDATKGRIWKIKNPAVLNPITGCPVAFKLMPQASPLVLAAPDSAIVQRGYFTTKSLFVTPYDVGQKYPAGHYILQSKKDSGLAQWTQADTSLEGVDPVLWYSFGVTHIVRIEDFPVMPCEYTGFSLKPFGFFTGNPALDIPPDANSASTLANGNGNSAACCTGGSCGEESSATAH